MISNASDFIEYLTLYGLGPCYAGCQRYGLWRGLNISLCLRLTLSYLHHYHTQLELAAIYGLSESNVCRTIRKTEDALIRYKRFSLPKHKNPGDQTVITNVTESPIERPKKTTGRRLRLPRLRCSSCLNPWCASIKKLSKVLRGL